MAPTKGTVAYCLKLLERAAYAGDGKALMDHVDGIVEAFKCFEAKEAEDKARAKKRGIKWRATTAEEMAFKSGIEKWRFDNYKKVFKFLRLRVRTSACVPARHLLNRHVTILIKTQYNTPGARAQGGALDRLLEEVADVHQGGPGPGRGDGPGADQRQAAQVRAEGQEPPGPYGLFKSRADRFAFR